MRFLCVVLVAFVFSFVFLISKFYRLSLEKDLRSHVSWCATNDSNIYRDNMSLLDWLCNVPHCSKNKSPGYLCYFFPNAGKLFLIEEEYWISGDEEQQIAKEILCEYQKDLTQKYFSERLGYLKLYPSVSKLTDAEFFMVTLKEFLEANQCETNFFGNEMYKTKEYKSYGTWGLPLFDATYELTDYAVVYHKIYLIAQTYCLTLRKDPLDTNTLSFKWMEDTKKVLNTKELKVSRY